MANGVCVFNEPDWGSWTDDEDDVYVPDPDDGTFEVPADYIPSKFTYGWRPSVKPKLVEPIPERAKSLRLQKANYRCDD
eukprot:4523703-Prorocentrum_lima.AAC.1